MDNALDIILSNIPIGSLKTKDLLCLKATCKNSNLIATDHLRYLSNTFPKWSTKQKIGSKLTEGRGHKTHCSKCRSCKNVKYNAFIKEYRCEQCFGELVTLTKARVYYRLKDNEISSLDYIQRFSYAYRKDITLYCLSDVIGLAMMKHHIFDLRNLDTFLSAPKADSKSKVKREEQLAKAMSKFDVSEYKTLASLECITSFLRNGEYGIRNIKNIISFYKPMNDFLITQATKPPYTIERYLLYAHENGLEQAKQQVSNDIQREFEKNARDQLHLERLRERKQSLIDALGQLNLSLRNDSTLCHEYIHGTGTLELHEVVSIMENMDFLYKHTNYSNLMQQAMARAHEEAREIIHDLYGYVSDSEVYYDLLQEHMDKVSISKRCQKQAIKQLLKTKDWNRGDLPQGLR
jgi:hypothetical protein